MLSLALPLSFNCFILSLTLTLLLVLFVSVTGVLCFGKPTLSFVLIVIFVLFFFCGLNNDLLVFLSDPELYMSAKKYNIWNI